MADRSSACAVSLSLPFDENLVSASRRVCGVDEAGRGPIAGPVFAAAVILDPDRPVDGLRDSKKLSERRRDELSREIREKSLAWAIEGLTVLPEQALIDGNRCPQGLAIPATAIVRGDDRVPAISAASILAKTARDAVMLDLHEQYPEYGFNRHKGYPTAFHLAQLEKYGVAPVHRKSYAPVRKILDLWYDKT